MKNDLFNQTLLKKYSKKFKPTYKQKETVREYIEKVEKGEFKAETKNYINFYDIILKEILGYERKNVSFDEKVDDGAGRSEFVLKSGDKKFMVVELKGQSVDLDKKQTRKSDTRTPVDQAFGYAIHTGDVEWILLSNYDEFRLYNYHEKTKYISFNASDLTDKEKLQQFLLVFSKESHINSDYIKKVRHETQIVERKLENEFYKLYNETRLMLTKELEEYNGFDRVKAVHYAQLILNRYMFICFAEDIDLLPSQITISTITSPIKTKNVKRNTIWYTLNDLFLDINEGNSEKDIYEYNGGLFKEDIGFIQIRDLIDDHKFFKDTRQNWKFEGYSIDIESLVNPYNKTINPIYKNLLTMSSFDFSSDLDVNILGHIFENSIGDIEELKSDAKGRRKKEGVFYTPEYITDYICRNTIIPYLSKSGKVNTVKALVDEYFGSEIDKLDEKVQNIKIVDPACGSGAFLNKAADILIEIHRSIHKQRYKGKQTLMPFFDNISKRREILLNNIYGVDLNEESVEITKLALFLKVSRKKLKLPNLDDNIKCGNSIIDNPKFTDKPFNWEDMFKDIFEEGGFDIVVGNPPYVRQEKIKEIKPYLNENYQVYTGLADLYVYFFEKGINILKNGGMFSFICSNKFTRANYGKNLRKLILENELKIYIDHTGNKVFEDAIVHACTITIKKGTHTKENLVLFNDKFEILQNKFDDSVWIFQNPEILNINDKIEKIGIKIKDITDLNIYYGIKTGYMKAFVIDKYIKNQLISENSKNKEIIRPFVRGKDISKWKIDYNDLYLILSKSGIDIEENYPSLFRYFSKFEENLKKRTDQGKYWFNLRDCDYYEKFENEKIIWAEIAPKPRFTIDNEQLFCETASFIMSKPNDYDLRYLTTLLNSKLLFWIFKQISPEIEGKRLRYKKQYVEQLPIYQTTPEQQKPFIEKADKMLKLNKDLMNEIKSFKDWLQHTFSLDKFSKKLDKYYELTLDEFLAELKKKKVNVKSRENYTLLKKGFEDSINIINPLLDEINETDKKIDSMVYDLYGLTNEEIKIIENNLN